MSAPLSGIRVVELASFVAAPAAGALLADLGAEVIKVEVPWGEIYRHSLPRFAGYDSDFGLAPHFHMDNRGKRSVALDLALPAAVDALKRLVDRADVLLTNMLPARLGKLGLDQSALRERRPDLIVARLSGYGPVGPEANSPAFDYSSYWARTGFMDMLHEPDAPPAFQRPGMGDHSAALALVVGILSALRQRDRGEPGQVIDVSLQHIGFYITGNDTAMTLVAGQTPPRHDRRAARNPLWNPTQDGRWIFLVMIESDRYWPELVRAVGLEALERDERFKGAVERYRNGADPHARRRVSVEVAGRVDGDPREAPPDLGPGADPCRGRRGSAGRSLPLLPNGGAPHARPVSHGGAAAADVGAPARRYRVCPGAVCRHRGRVARARSFRGGHRLLVAAASK